MRIRASKILKNKTQPRLFHREVWILLDWKKIELGSEYPLKLVPIALQPRRIGKHGLKENTTLKFLLQTKKTSIA